jgi:hypothetical protein
MQAVRIQKAESALVVLVKNLREHLLQENVIAVAL